MLTKGQVLADRYQIMGAAGRRGAEVLYTATDLRRKSTVTVREVDVEDEAARLALESEARLLVELRHPSLPFVIDDFTEGQRLYLVTEFIGEESLAERMRRDDQPLPVEEALNWVWELLCVLEYLHGLQRPILHGRIEPSNIYVSDGRVFLIGLGSASQDGGRQTAQARVADAQSRSLGFASPEQIRGLATTPASDIYSLAATLYYLLTNVVPDDALQRALSESDPLESVKARRPELHARVARAVMTGLAPVIKRRPQSAGDMKDLLFPEEAGAAGPRRGYARALRAAGLLAALALLAGAAWGFYQPSCDKIPPFISQRVTLPCLTVAPTPPSAAPPQHPPQDEAAGAKARSDELAAEAASRLQSGDYGGAIQRAEEARNLNPNNAYALAVKCDALWDTKHEAAEYETAPQLKRVPDELKECAKGIVTLVTEPRTAEDHAALAWAHAAREKYATAIAHADKALSLKRDLVMAYMARAVAVLGDAAALHEPRYQRALADLLEVTTLRPQYAQAHYLLSQVYLLRDLLPLAEREAKEAARLSPQAKSFTRLGDISRRFGDLFQKQGQKAKAAEQYDKAAEQYDKALAENRDFLPAYKRLARLHYDREKWGDALDVLGRGLLVRGDEAALHYLRGLTYEALDNQPEALAAFTRAAALEPNNPEYRARRDELHVAARGDEDDSSDFER